MNKQILIKSFIDTVVFILFLTSIFFILKMDA